MRDISKARFRRPATAVSNSYEFDPAVARQQQGVVSNDEFDSVVPNSK